MLLTKPSGNHPSCVGFYSAPARRRQNDLDDVVRSRRLVQGTGSDCLTAATAAPAARAKAASCDAALSTTTQSDSGVDAASGSSGKAPEQFMFHLGTWTASPTFD